MITVCGEGLVDLVDEGGGVFRAHPGGSPLNVAVGLARLGHPVSLLARLGHDTFGRLLRDHLTACGVSDRDLIDATEPTTLAVVRLEAAAASYDFYVHGTANDHWQPEELPDRLADDVVALHTGSLASWLPPAREAIEALLCREHRRGAVTLTYDPNVRPLLMGDRRAARHHVERLVSLVDVVKVSDEDLGWLYPDHTAVDIAVRWAGTGPALVVVTEGARGATAVTAAGHVLHRPARQVATVDTVGAGDAFTAGLIAWLAGAGRLGCGAHATTQDISDAELAALLDWAGLVAALTCARAGATPPTRVDVDAAHG